MSGDIWSYFKLEMLIVGFCGVLTLLGGYLVHRHFKGQETANTAVTEQDGAVGTRQEETGRYVLARRKGMEYELRRVGYTGKKAVLYMDGSDTGSDQAWSGEDEVLDEADIPTFKEGEAYNYGEDKLIKADENSSLWNSTREEATKYVNGLLGTGYTLIEEVYLPNGFTLLMTNSSKDQIACISFTESNSLSDSSTLFVLSGKEQYSVLHKLKLSENPKLYRAE